jgi:sec-independent protein translocase protein TatA
MLHLFGIQPLAFGMPGFDEWIVVAIVGLLIFGKRLPEVGRSLGQGIVEFKKGLKGIETDVEQASSAPSNRPAMDQRNTAYKFDPNTGKPLQAQIAAPPGAKFDPYTGKPLNNEVVGEVVENEPASPGV